MSSPFKFPAWDLFLGGQELLWHLGWLEMPCPWCVMRRKGRDLPWLGPGGGGLEMWSKPECVLESHLLSPLPCVPLAAPGAFGLSQPQLQQGSDTAVLAHRHGAPQTIALGPSHGGSNSALLGRVCPDAGASQSSQVEGQRVSSRPGQADCGAEQVGCRRSARLGGLRLPLWSHSWIYRHPSSGLLPR